MLKLGLRPKHVAVISHFKATDVKSYSNKTEIVGTPTALSTRLALTGQCAIVLTMRFHAFQWRASLS